MLINLVVENLILVYIKLRIDKLFVYQVVYFNSKNIGYRYLFKLRMFV